MKQALVICGPTATGKTNLALEFARKFDGELISADSRQVYKGLDLVTGKDVPEDNSVKSWGLDVVTPDQEWSVSSFLKMVQDVLKDIWGRDKLPIFVGGTGLYLKALQQSIDTVQIKPNPKLRERLETLSLTELQKELEGVAAAKWESMNQSDRNNPRRLVRALEVAYSAPLAHGAQIPPLSHVDTLIIGLELPREVLQQKIEERVTKRINSDYGEELKLVESLGVDRPAVSALGYDILSALKQNTISREEAIKRWTAADFSYAKRQMVWFQKQPNINWFTATNPKMPIVQLVSDWYIKP